VRRWLGVVVFLALVLGGAALLRGDVPCELLSVQPACEVALRPGPSEDVLALVEVTGAPTEEATGELRLTTVAVEEDLDLREWLRWRTSDVVEVTSRDVIFPPGADRREVAEQNAALMADSQLTATIVALEQLGYELDGRGAAVAAVTSDAVTDDLVPGDLIVAVDGDAVAENEEVVAAVRSRRPGDEIVFEVVSEDGDRREVAVALGASPEDPNGAYVGILLITDLDLPVDIAIDAGVIGGPSAGLLFALSIVELLGDDDLTDGAIIAGTGTVARDGSVGPVGGVPQKLLGATAPGGENPPAEVFLVPRANLESVRRAPVASDVLVVPVETFEDALDALAELREGRRPEGALALAAGG
jgi:Lon-like protease